MPTISLITAVVAGKHQHITETAASIVDQELPEGWTWEWVVQEDGETGLPGQPLDLDDPRISYAMADRGRAATARTLASARATGKYVRALDADDVLTPGALARDIAVLESHPVGWVVSPALDMFPDGRLVPGPRDPVPGPLPPTLMYDSETAGLLAVLGCTATAHTSLVRALGAWQALPLDEDVALVVALEAVAPGWMQAEPSIHYRKWSEQTTAGKDVHAAAPSGAGRDVILGRADALRAAGWRWAPNMVVDHEAVGQ